MLVKTAFMMKAIKGIKTQQKKNLKHFKTHTIIQTFLKKMSFSVFQLKQYALNQKSPVQAVPGFGQGANRKIHPTTNGHCN